MESANEMSSVTTSSVEQKGPADTSVGMMHPAEITRIAWEGVTRNKIRSLLTMLGVIIGVAAVIIMISISAGTEATIAEQIEGLGANLAFIQASFGRGGPGADNNAPSLVFDDVALVEGVNGVIGTSVEQQSSQDVKAAGVSLSDVSILGTTSDFPSVRAVDIDEGRYFNETEVDRTAKVAILGAGLAQELFGESDPIGQSVTAGNTKLTVIGVAGEGEGVLHLDVPAAPVEVQAGDEGAEVGPTCVEVGAGDPHDAVQRAVLLQNLAQAASVDPFHGEVGIAGLGIDVGVENRHDTDVVEPSGRLRLQQETLAHLLFFSALDHLRRLKDLQGDLTTDARILGQEDTAHRTASQFPQDAVAVNLPEWRRRCHLKAAGTSSRPLDTRAPNPPATTACRSRCPVD